MPEPMVYDLVEHRHRFSVWAAARAAQRRLKGGTVRVLRDALEQSGVVEFAKERILPVDQVAYDEIHRAWCRSIVSYLASRDVDATFGRAAKLIAIYLKSMVILNGGAETSLTNQGRSPARRRHSPGQHAQSESRAINAQNDMAESKMDRT